MPGLSALQKLNSDMLNLGDEVKIRSARGEKPVTIQIPQTVEDIDDSDDFKFGMPSLSEEEQAQADAAAAEQEREANDFSDITGEDDSSDESSAENPKVQETAPDLSNLLNTQDLNFSDLDLSDFEDEPQEPEPEPEPEEIPIEDMDLASLLAPANSTNPTNSSSPQESAKSQVKSQSQTSNFEDVNLEEINSPQESSSSPLKSQKSSSSAKNQQNSQNTENLFEGLDPDIFKTPSSNTSQTNPFEVPDPFSSASSNSPSSAQETDTFSSPSEASANKTDAFSQASDAFTNPSEDFVAPSASSLDQSASSANPSENSAITTENPPSQEEKSPEQTENSQNAPSSNDKTLVDSLNEDFENDNPQNSIDLNADIPTEFNEVPDFSNFDFDDDASADKTDASDDKSDTFAEPSASSFDESASPLEQTDVSSQAIETAAAPSDASTTSSENFAKQAEAFEQASDTFSNPSDASTNETASSANPSDASSNQSENPPEQDFDFGDTSGLDDDLPDFDTNEFDSNSFDDQKIPNLDDINIDDLINAANSSSQTENSPFSTENLAEQTQSSAPQTAPSANEPDASAQPSAPSANETDASAQPSAPFANETASSAAPSDNFTEETEQSTNQSEQSASQELPDDFFDEPSGSVPSPSDDVSEETFDTSDIDGLNFEDSQSPESFDSNFGTSDSDDDDFFTIPGFSDTQTANLSQKKQNVQSPNFAQASKAGEDETKKQKNTFTDAEYERFKKNLNSYPLNVKVALEDLIVKNEFTDDALFELLEKVLRKVPARTLASELEKLTDKNLEVPRDFERRSAEEYAAYKKSLEYKLKNRIIPGALLISGAAILVFCLFVLINTFIVKPSIAEHLYKQGYALIDQEMYPQSEERFDQALTYKPKKKWFYRYAENYQNHKQFDRARLMYRGILQRFNHEKDAGLKWAKMESDDLFNYEEAERLLKREVLDYHVNDADAILQLGDLYLDWATEKDSSKYPLAKEQYDFLISLYGTNDTYLSRQMRYFIRTDNLSQVLRYKEIFYPRKKSLGSQDLTELSGFLLDKRYGKLSVAEEPLRFYIEDLRSLLERALNADLSNPLAHYNMARYFVQTSNPNAAIYYLKNAIQFFDEQNVRNNRDTYKFINSYRLLGEQYIEQKEYLLAEENYGKGINLFEDENASSGFESTEDIGHLYADLADLDYFVAADNDTALTNYINAVDNKYDNSSVRYKIGYIQYQKQNYAAALGSFIKSHDTNPNDMNLNLALANTLSLSNDSYVARGYYENLLEKLDAEREKNRILYSGQVTSSQTEIIDMYMKVANNLGVTLSRLANQTGNSAMNAQAIVYLQESLRSWDALTRNPQTMVRLQGSNLAEQNIKYIINPTSSYKPEIYTEIKRTLYGEKEID